MFRFFSIARQTLLLSLRAPEVTVISDDRIVLRPRVFSPPTSGRLLPVPGHR